MSLALLALIPQLVASGIATIAQVKALFTTQVPGLTDAELNAVCELIGVNAAAQQKLAQADQRPNVGA
jgi:hypothetical protein